MLTGADTAVATALAEFFWVRVDQSLGTHGVWADFGCKARRQNKL